MRPCTLRWSWMKGPLVSTGTQCEVSVRSWRMRNFTHSAAVCLLTPYCTSSPPSRSSEGKTTVSHPKSKQQSAITSQNSSHSQPSRVKTAVTSQNTCQPSQVKTAVTSQNSSQPSQVKAPVSKSQVKTSVSKS